MLSRTRIIIVGMTALSIGGLLSSLGLAWGGGALLGIGGSLVATGLATKIIASQVYGLDVDTTVEALRGASPFTRSHQTIELTFEHVERRIRVTAVQRFDLHPSSPSRGLREFRIFSTLARWGRDGGFLRVIQPDGSVLEGATLTPFLTTVAEKHQFSKSYALSSDGNQFVFITYGFFQYRDHLSWTIDHISRDLRVRVANRTALAGRIAVKISHHNDEQIYSSAHDLGTPGTAIDEFDFLGDVLPFQGFELHWAFEPESNYPGEG